MTEQKPWYVDAAVAHAKQQVKAELNLITEMVNGITTMAEAEVLMESIHLDLSILTADWRRKLQLTHKTKTPIRGIVDAI